MILRTERHIPTAQLQPFIKEYHFVESDAEMENRILPNTSMSLAIRYNGKMSVKESGQDLPLPNLILSGIWKSPRLIRYGERTGNLLVHFNPGGAAAFFPRPFNELTDLSLPADSLANCTHLLGLPEQLAAIEDHEARIDTLERILCSRLSTSRPDPLLTAAVEMIRSAHGVIAIKALAASLYISQDAFEKRFRQAIGTSPKHFCTVTRLQYAIQIHSPEKSLTDTALTAGYYDQAHFIRDFKGLTGLSPRQFFDGRPHW